MALPKCDDCGKAEEPLYEWKKQEKSETKINCLICFTAVFDKRSEKYIFVRPAGRGAVWRG